MLPTQKCLLHTIIWGYDTASAGQRLTQQAHPWGNAFSWPRFGPKVNYSLLLQDRLVIQVTSRLWLTQANMGCLWAEYFWFSSSIPRGMEHVIRLQPLNKLTFKRAKGLLSTKHTPTKDRSSQGGRWSLLRSNFSPVSWHPTPLAPEYQASFLNRHTSVLTNRNEQVPPTFYTTMSDRISVHSD